MWLAENGATSSLVISNLAPAGGIPLSDAQVETIRAAHAQGRSVSMKGGVLTVGDLPPPPDPRASMSADRTDFAANAAEAGLVTWGEAERWASGAALPDIARAFVETLPPAARPRAQLELLTRRRVNRLHPAIVSIGAALGLAPDAIDALFA